MQLNISDYQSGERNIIRPLKFARLHAACQTNPASINIFTNDLFYSSFNISTEQAEEILQIEKNYIYNKRPAIAAGKLCDVTVDKQDFYNAIIETQNM